MKQLWYAIGRLAWWQKLIVAALLALVTLTWAAVCLVLFGSPTP